MVNLQATTLSTIKGEDLLAGMMVANPECTITLGGKALLVQDILDGTIKPQFTSLIGNKEYTRLDKIDIEILLRAIFFAEKNPNSDKMLSDRVIVRFKQDIEYLQDTPFFADLIYTVTESSSHNEIQLNMENYDSTGNPKADVIEAIYAFLNPKKEDKKLSTAHT